MSWEIIGVCAIVLIFVLLFIFRGHPTVKLYWKYALILLPILVFLILQIIQKSKPTNDPKKDQELERKIGDLQQDLQEAQATARVETAIAKEKNQETIKKLEEIKALPDKQERIKKLADLIG